MKNLAFISIGIFIFSLNLIAQPSGYEKFEHSDNSTNYEILIYYDKIKTEKKNKIVLSLKSEWFKKITTGKRFKIASQTIEFELKCPGDYSINKELLNKKFYLSDKKIEIEIAVGENFEGGDVEFVLDNLKVLDENSLLKPATMRVLLKNILPYQKNVSDFAKNLGSNINYIESNEGNLSSIIQFTSSQTTKSNPYNLTGVIENNYGISVVLVNDQKVKNLYDNSFSTELHLKPNSNKITVEVIDKKGNIFKSEYFVTLENVHADWQNYALFFAAEDYKKQRVLDNPIENAENIGEILKNDYNFKVEIVKNPTRNSIKSKLKKYDNNFKNGNFDKNGQLLIFFSGHGVDEYFLPIGADMNDLDATAILYYSLARDVDKMNCKHIMLMIDACHSYSFEPATRGVIPRERYNELTPEEKIIEEFKRNKTRIFFTSDARNEQTPDNSDFAKKFIDALNSHGGKDFILEIDELDYDYLKKASPQAYRNDFGESSTDANFLFIYQGE